jgi:hypothetical protein
MVYFSTVRGTILSTALVPIEVLTRVLHDS